MDIYCPRCGEPCDVDELHSMTAEVGSFEQARRIFYDRSKGCGQLFNGRPCKVREDSEQAEQARMLSEVLGDDVDGIAAMHEDFGGLL